MRWLWKQRQHCVLSQKIPNWTLDPTPFISSAHCLLLIHFFSFLKSDSIVCNSACGKYFHFLNYELYRKETNFKEEQYTHTFGNILTTGLKGTGNDTFGNAIHSFESRAAATHSKCILIHTEFLPSGLWRQNARLSFKWAESHLKAFFPSIWELTQSSYRQRLFITVARKSLFKFLMLL